MANIIINNKKHTIEMNKTDAKNAAIYGTDEYNALQQARRDYPTYRVVTVAKKGAKAEYKGLTFEFMKKYIAANDEDGSRMQEFKELTDNTIGAANYTDVKDWFLMTYPEIEESHKNRETMLKKIEEFRKARQAEKSAA